MNIDIDQATDASQPGENDRLPLLAPADLNREQADVYETIHGKYLPWARKSGFVAEGAEGTLLGPFNALLYSPELGSAMLRYLSAEREATDLEARVREVVILTVGAACKSAYEVYAHRAVAAKAGLAAEDIEALASGAEPKTLSASEFVAHRFVRALVTEHRVPAPLYAEAVGSFSRKCLVDMVHLVGLYLSTSAILNAFNVPVPQGS